MSILEFKIPDKSIFFLWILKYSGKLAKDILAKDILKVSFTLDPISP